MQLDESRRLTGPNLFSDLPGAICDVLAPSEQHAALIAAWQQHIDRLLVAVGWRDSERYHRAHATGVSLVISAPIDVLYAATDVNEAAVSFAFAQLEAAAMPDFDETVERLVALIAEEHNPALLELADTARRHGARWLTDDDETSMGYGASAQCWPTDHLPGVSTIDWSRVSDQPHVPVALVTGTNGKSTTVRMAASIITASGSTPGLTSTDYIKVGHDVIDTGDYSGPGGARQLLRDTRTEVALLEVARGGMLRRGLGVTDADAALVTNVAADHLGEYGIHTVPELRDAKFIVARGLAPDCPLILNADDEGVVAHANGLVEPRIVWFSEDIANPVIAHHFAQGGTAFAIASGVICRLEEGAQHDVVRVANVPATLGGNARHNVQNALAAASLAHALGADDRALRDGLVQFSGDASENPGRGNLFSGRGIQAIVDFAHNEHGLRAMAATVASMPAKRRLVLMGQAGDRSDALIDGLTRAALSAQPDQLVICELPGYERGRAPDDVPRLIEQVAVAAGLAPESIHQAASPVDGTRFALDWAQDGDLLLILALTQRGPCTQMIERALSEND